MTREEAEGALEWFDAFTEKFHYSEFCTDGNREYMEMVRDLIEEQTEVEDK